MINIRYSTSKVRLPHLSQPFISVLILLCWISGTSQAADSSRPNIVLIMADDMGYECIQANGSLDYETPRLNQMAAQGLRFTHCYSQPICTPSRVKLMTGLSNKRNHVKFGVLDREQVTFGQLLRDSGYATCVAGKWQLGRDPELPQHFGFQQSLLWQHTRGRTDQDKRDTRYPNPHLERNGEALEFEQGEFSTDLFVDFISNFIADHQDQPFFVYYPMALVHCPFCPTPKSSDWNPASRGSKSYKGDPKHFADMVNYADHAVGRILDSLKENHLDENTLVIFIGDNGTDKPIVTNTVYGEVTGAKGQTTDGGNHVPCIMRWPNGIAAPGEICQDIIDFSDFLPTLCQLAQAGPPTQTDGRSFLPQLMGQPSQPRECIYQWYQRDGIPSKAVEFARNQRYKLYATGEFYDVSRDRSELNPVQKLSPQQQHIRRRLQQEIDRHRDIVPPRARNAGNK